MKVKNILIVCALLSTMMLSSCYGFLEENPKTQEAMDQFWRTREQGMAGLNAVYFGGFRFLIGAGLGTAWAPNVPMYTGIMSGLFLDRRHDRDFTINAERGNFTLLTMSGAAGQFWHELYIGVNRANLVIEQIPRMTGVFNQDEINSMVAQAYFFRALNLFELVKNFGDVPVFETPFTNPADTFMPRSPSIEAYQLIERDLLAAIPALPNTTFYQNNGRVTRAMAQALLARVYLQWAGYPMRGGNEKYARAAAMAQQVINGGSGHALIHPNGTTTDTNSAFNLIRLAKAGTPGAAEIIYASEFNRALGPTQDWFRRAIPTAVTNFGHIGSSVAYSGFVPTPMLIESFHPDDIRAMEHQFFFTYLYMETGERFDLGEVGNWFWFDYEALRDNVGSSNNIPLMRFAEVLLIAAEGLARTGNETAARGYLNQVRRRAGLADNTDTGDALIQAILTERLHEFPLEFLVWDDIRRTRLYPQPAGVGSGRLNWVPLSTAAIQNKPAAGENTVGLLPEWVLLWPIPLAQMSANPAFEGQQNPGWQ